jgi:hypothetical protein
MRSGQFDIYVVHMVRDGRGVAWSLSKSYAKNVKAGLQRELKPKCVSRTSLRWTMINLAAEHLRRVAGPDNYIRVRYEDFAADPVTQLNRIGGMIGIDLGPIGEGLRRGDAVNPNHQIAGNRLRMNSTIKMEKDESWRSQMPEPKQRTVSRLCGWLLRRYKYA